MPTADPVELDCARDSPKRWARIRRKKIGRRPTGLFESCFCLLLRHRPEFIHCPEPFQLGKASRRPDMCRDQRIHLIVQKANQYFVRAKLRFQLEERARF